jgi:hypothetical protein
MYIHERKEIKRLNSCTQSQTFIILTILTHFITFIGGSWAVVSGGDEPFYLLVVVI